MSVAPRGCLVLLKDGNDACYLRNIPKKEGSGKFHEVLVNDGGIRIVGENEIKSIHPEIPGWKRADGLRQSGQSS